MPTLQVKDFLGGKSLINPQDLKDNQFVELKNWFYNKNKRLQTRYGIDPYFAPVPDAMILINACDATTNWVATDDAVTVATGTAIRGTNSISFGITVATSGNNFATLTNASIVANITTAKGYLGFWFKPPTGFNTNLTNVKVRLGSDSSNYYEWTLPTLTEATSQFIKLTFASAVTTGAPVDATITYFRLQVTYTGAYTDKVGVLIDDIRCYSATNAKPITSYFFFQRDDNALRTAICMCGTNTFRWDDTSSSWEVIDTGLTEFETMTGMTTFRTRWSFAVYKNIIYMANGVDSYRSFNGTAITTYAGQPKFRYLRYMGDRVFGAGDDTNPSTLYYTNALAADASNLANSVVVGGDELGRINALYELGKFILAFKDKKIYSISVSGSGSAEPIDTQNGGYSNRVTWNVGNALLYENDQGLDNLKQKQAATGAEALESTPYTDDLRELINQIAPIQLNANCGYYYEKINNYFFSFDTGNDNIPETTLVYSSLIGKTWSQYTYPAVFQYGFYIDSSNVYHHLAASANVGVIYEIETGFLDDGGVIEYDLKSKAWDFGEPELWKDFHSVTLEGLKSEGGTMYIEIYVDDELVYTATLNDDFIDLTATPVTIASNPIAEYSIGGGSPSANDVDLYPYKVKLAGELFASGFTISVRMYNTDGPIVLTLDKMRIRYDNNTEDIFPYDNII